MSKASIRGEERNIETPKLNKFLNNYNLKNYKDENSKLFNSRKASLPSHNRVKTSLGQLVER